MKKLIYIPIIHTEMDMGSLGAEIKKEYLEKFGKKKWDKRADEIFEIWEKLKEKIQKLGIPFSAVRVYQDGLPVCGKEKDIVTDLASKGSPNHELLLWLGEQGAHLEGTEDPKILLREYQLLKSIQSLKGTQPGDQMVEHYAQEAEKLLKERDLFIAKRIETTLQEGETGLLFIGLLHRVDEFLPSSIGVTYLIHRLPFHRDFEMRKIYG